MVLFSTGRYDQRYDEPFLVEEIMNIVNKIHIAIDFSETPGAREKKDGEFSGQQFLEEQLLPKFKDAMSKRGLLLIDLDDTWGYPSSFISGSFGELSKQFGALKTLRHLTFKSDDDRLLIDQIKKVIKDPEAR